MPSLILLAAPMLAALSFQAPPQASAPASSRYAYPFAHAGKPPACPPVEVDTKAAPGAAYHSLYLYGRVPGPNGSERVGLFRSDDAGASFKAIDDERHRFCGVLSLAADPLEHGTVYLGTQGRGVFVGKPLG